MKRHHWRWWFHAIHRDIGYLCVGLVLIYSISGIAVNHIDEPGWNPNYWLESSQADIGPVDTVGADDEALAQTILERLDEPPVWQTLFVPEPGKLRVITEELSVDVELATGKALLSTTTPILGLYEANQLHLNHHKKGWTWVADVFAGCLIVLAISGMFLLRGKNGIKGRGAWLVGIGSAVPLFFLWLYG